MSGPENFGTQVGSNDLKLMRAAGRGNTEEAVRLLTANEGLGRQGKENAIQAAIDSGHSGTAIAMLKTGYDPHATETGQMVWTQAVQKMDKRLIGALIEHPTQPHYSTVAAALATANDMPGNEAVAGSLKGWLASHEREKPTPEPRSHNWGPRLGFLRPAIA